MTTNVPQPAFGERGFIAPDSADVLAGAKADINAAFGGNLNMADETPQGQLAVSRSASIDFKNDTFLHFTNQVDPAYATGRMQDAIARIYFLDRHPARATVVVATVSGLTGAIIPAGSLAQTVDGVAYSSLSAVTIPASGSADVTFQANVAGPIPCPPNTLTRILRTVSGWDSVNNANAGIPGAYVEGRDEFEARRYASVAVNARAILSSIRAAVLNVPGVLDAYVTENETAAARTVGGVVLAPHSLYVAAVGGTDQDVAEAIWSKKPPGCNYNGDTTVTVEDRESGYAVPYPSYEVTFQRPTDTRILFSVVLSAGPGVPSDAAQQVQNVIIQTFNGAVDGERQQIGGTVFASRFFCGIAALGPWARIVSIKIGRTTATADTVELDIDEFPSVAAGDIAVSLV